ncbi:MAG: LysM peptidoglycan-binding domain-containing protein [Chthoniobacterales bacterium]|nr:LysM peptidoglycan-binding domain-containing protein [Chthoniobacterales bacterium]
MKLPAFITRKKKLGAVTARRARTLGLPDEMDYEEMGEPNMKLSRALLIVLVLHVVAVAGIVAFNTIKPRENFTLATPEAQAPAVAEASVGPAGTTAPNELAQTATSPAPVAAKSNEADKTKIKDSGKTYVVARGDNPVTIARHFKVSEADLLALNQITDPRKLQINQKLRIPESHSLKGK